MPTPDPGPSATLEAIRDRAGVVAKLGPPRPGGDLINAAHRSAADVPRLLAAVDAALDQADDLTRKSEALDAEAEYVAGEHPEAAAVAVLKRERSIAYDECARWFREAITRALDGDTDA